MATEFFEETVASGSKFLILQEEVLAVEKSKYQDIRIFTNETYGKVLTLDGVVQVTLKDEHIYHEMMAHVAMMATAKRGSIRVAIIGGGDGGVLREVLKHSHIEAATLIDIDERVIALCKEHMPTVSDGAFDSPKATTICTDGFVWLQECDAASLDIVLIDSSDDDDDGANSSLFTDSFYTAVAKALKPNGIVVKQSGCNQIQLDSNYATMKQYKKFFNSYGMYYQNVPTYPGGDMGFAWGTNGPSLESIEIDECPVETVHYHKPIHHACMANPLHIRKSIEAIRAGKEA